MDNRWTTDGQQMDTYNNVNNVNNVKKKYCQNSDEFRLSSLLLGEIRRRKPDFKRPNLQQWSVHIDRMIRIDNRKADRIEAVIRWCQADNGNNDGTWKGWQNNILSTEKLRKQFDKLELNMQKERNDGSGKNIGSNQPAEPYIR